MNIISEYTWSHLKQNKRHTVFLFLAILIASTLLCSACVFVQTQWNVQRHSVLEFTGDWQGKFTEPLPGDQVRYVAQNPAVQDAQMQSDWQTLGLSGAKRSYLTLSDLNRSYWNDLADAQDLTLTEGRLPEEPGEIAVSRQFFSENPDYALGDRLTLPVGYREANGTPLSFDAMETPGENLKTSGERTVTIVGILNTSAISAYPGYYAYGFLDTDALASDAGYLVSAKLHRIQDAPSVFSQMAESLGISGDTVEYNSYLLNLYGVNVPGETGASDGISSLALVAVLSVVLLMAVFVTLIYNAFAVSANSRVKQLGILKSIGATPSQIRRSVLLEGLLLCCLAVPLGILIGYAGMAGMLSWIYSVMGSAIKTSDVLIFSWLTVVIAAALSLVTVLLSAWAPARRLSRMLAIDAIRSPMGRPRLKKAKEHRLMRRLFGFEGELAADAFSSNKRAWRATILALALFIALICGFQSFTSIWMLDNRQSMDSKQYSLEARLHLTEDPSPQMIQQLKSLEHSQRSALSRDASGEITVTEEELSDAMRSLGGFAGIGHMDKTNLRPADGAYRVFAHVSGLDEETFADYCRQIGVDPKDFSNPADRKAIVVNSMAGTLSDYRQKYGFPSVEFLSLQPGSPLDVTEYAMESAAEPFPLSVGAVTGTYPVLDNTLFPMDLCVVVPMDVYTDLVKTFSPERALRNQEISLKLDVPEEHLEETQKEAEAILGSYLTPEDYDTVSTIDEKNEYQKTQNTLSTMVNAFALFLGVVGIAGAFSAVSGSISMRRKQFAVLRSVGLTPRGLRKALLIESVIFSIVPLLFSLPIWLAATGLMLVNVQAVTLPMFLVSAPIGFMLLCVLLVMASVWLAYALAARKLLRQNLVDIIKEDDV